MFEDVLSTMMSVPDFEKVAVATVCPAAGIIAKKYGAIVLSTSQDEGQTAAVEAVGRNFGSQRNFKYVDDSRRCTPGNCRRN